MDNPFGMPRLRVWTNKLMSKFISRIIGLSIPDTQCGFRLINRKVLEKVTIKTNKFEVESEILIKAVWQGFLVRSVPIRSIYFKGGQSKINPFTDSIRFIKFVWQLRNERI